MREKMIHDFQLCFNLSLRLVPSKGQPVWPRGGRRFGSKREETSVCNTEAKRGNDGSKLMLLAYVHAFNSHRDPHDLFIKCINRCPLPFDPIDGQCLCLKKEEDVQSMLKKRRWRSINEKTYFIFLKQKCAGFVCLGDRESDRISFGNLFSCRIFQIARYNLFKSFHLSIVHRSTHPTLRPRSEWEREPHTKTIFHSLMKGIHYCQTATELMQINEFSNPLNCGLLWASKA